MAITVRETIHHGNYRNVRQVSIPDTAPSTLARMVRDCPYTTAGVPDSVLRGLHYALSSGGSMSYGWVDWEVVR